MDKPSSSEDLRARVAEMSTQNKLAEIVGYAQAKGIHVQMSSEGFDLNFSEAEAGSVASFGGPKPRRGWINL